MHDLLRDRIWRNLEALPEDRLYQVLDYIEFLNSKYARQPVRSSSPFQRFGEKLEDRLRVNRVGFDAIRSTLGVVGTADKMVSGLTEAGRSLIREVGDSVLPAEQQAPRTQGGPRPVESGRESTPPDHRTPPPPPPGAAPRRDFRIDE